MNNEEKNGFHYTTRKREINLFYKLKLPQQSAISQQLSQQEHFADTSLLFLSYKSCKTVLALATFLESDLFPMQTGIYSTKIFDNTNCHIRKAQLLLCVFEDGGSHTLFVTLLSV